MDNVEKEQVCVKVTTLFSTSQWCVVGGILFLYVYSTVMIYFFIFISIFLVFSIWVAFVYRNFVKTVNKATKAFADIQKDLDCRYDIALRLAKVTERYLGENSPVLQNILNARKVAMDTLSSSEKGGVEIKLTEAIEAVYIISEDYPDLRQDIEFKELHRVCDAVEGSIRISRENYNNIIIDLNMEIESFPGDIIAELSGYKKMQFFE